MLCVFKYERQLAKRPAFGPIMKRFRAAGSGEFFLCPTSKLVALPKYTDLSNTVRDPVRSSKELNSQVRDTRASSVFSLSFSHSDYLRSAPICTSMHMNAMCMNERYVPV
jgi:hypothetical protein